MSIDEAVSLAREMYGDISFCVGKTCWEECVAYGMLWFNSTDHSTHVIKMEQTRD